MALRKSRSDQATEFAAISNFLVNKLHFHAGFWGQMAYELEEALSYGRIDADTRTTLRALWPVVEPEIGHVLNLLYEHIARWPQLNSLFANPERMESAKTRQKAHWQRLFAAEFSADYVASVRRVAATHARIGLKPQYYMGSYLVALEELHSVVLQRMIGTVSSPASRPRAIAAIRAIDRGLMFDLMQVVTGYLSEVEDNFRRRLDDLATQFQDVMSGFRERMTVRAGLMATEAQALLISSDASMAQARSVSDGADKSTGEMQTIAAAAEEFASSISEISRQTRQAATVTATAVATVEEAGVIVTSLSNAAGKIGDVVSLIQSIAGQTNLLALNATIEAARAGEAGRGFAVVAGEVKGLSAQTARATDDIRRQVISVRSVVDQIAASMQAIAVAVSQVSEATTAISSAVEAQSAVTQEIGRAVGAAAQGVADISETARQAQDVAAENAGKAKTLTATSIELNGEVAALDAQAVEFIDRIRFADRRKDPREPLPVKVVITIGGVALYQPCLMLSLPSSSRVGIARRVGRRRRAKQRLIPARVDPFFMGQHFSGLVLDGMLDNISLGGAAVRLDGTRIPADADAAKIALANAGITLSAKIVNRGVNAVNLAFADRDIVTRAMQVLGVTVTDRAA